MTFTTVLFYILAFVLVIAAVRVITARSPVTAVLHLILVFANAAMLWMLLGAEFLALLLRVPPGSPEATDSLAAFVLGVEFRTKFSPADRYLAILGWIASHHPADFGEFVRSLPAGRHYLSLPPEEVLEMFRSRAGAALLSGLSEWKHQVSEDLLVKARKASHADAVDSLYVAAGVDAVDAVEARDVGVAFDGAQAGVGVGENQEEHRHHQHHGAEVFVDGNVLRDGIAQMLWRRIDTLQQRAQRTGAARSTFQQVHEVAGLTADQDVEGGVGGVASDIAGTDQDFEPSLR